MGMYTKLHCNIKIDREAEECIEILKYMLGKTKTINFEVPKHSLFKAETQRWKFMLNSSSYYFTGTSNSELIKDDISGYVLHCDCDFKNYEGEIESFLDWISKYANYSDYYEYIGYERYEEAKVPELIFMRKGNYKKVNLKEDIINVYED